MSILPPQFPFNELPENTIVPPPSEDENDFIQYLNRLYEDIAFAVNSKDSIFFTIPISNAPTDIPNLPTFGAFILCVSGTQTGMPSYVWALTKNNSSLVGTVNILSNQVGTITPWVGATLTVTSTATNFQIQHSVATTANFNIRFLTTI